MLIYLMYSFLARSIVPNVGALLTGLFPYLMVFMIIMGGLRLMFKAVDINLPSVGGILLGAVLTALGFLGTSVFQALGWMFRNFFKWLPKLFKGTKEMFQDMGMNSIVSSLLATVITVLFIAII